MPYLPVTFLVICGQAGGTCLRSPRAPVRLRQLVSLGQQISLGFKKHHWLMILGYTTLWKLRMIIWVILWWFRLMILVDDWLLIVGMIFQKHPVEIEDDHYGWENQFLNTNSFNPFNISPGANPGS